MSRFRNIIIKSINKISQGFSTVFLQKITNQNIILPFYHTISDANCIHIKHLYKVKNIKDFEKDLDFLLKHFKPIDYNEFIDLKTKKKKPNKHSFLLTFDDGLKEFYTIIAPILIKKGIPAICFLNSAFIDNKGIFYRYKASLLIEEIEKKPELINNIKSFNHKIIDYKKYLLSITYQNKSILDDIAKQINFDFKGFLMTENPYLTSEQIKYLIKQGFYFGAHSIDHPEYQFLDREEQIRQTSESIDFIVKKFDLKYKIFSFPFTDYNVSKSFFNHIQSHNITENTFGSAGQKKDICLNNFQRIPFEKSNIPAKNILKTELMYYFFKKPFGKNIIKRK